MGMVCCTNRNEPNKEGEKPQVPKLYEEGQYDAFNFDVHGDYVLNIEQDDLELSNKYKHQYELMTHMNKQYFFTEFTKLSDTSNQEMNWVQKVDEDQIKIYVSEKGSELTNEYFLAYAEFKYSSEHDLQALMKTFFKDREKSDPDCLCSDIIGVQDHYVLLINLKNKPYSPTVKPKEYLEKRIPFKIDGKHFVFSSALPDDFKPVSEGHDRVLTVLSYYCFEKLNDGSVVMKYLIQRNYSIPTAYKTVGVNSIISGLIDSFKKQYKASSEYCLKNQKVPVKVEALLTESKEIKETEISTSIQQESILEEQSKNQ